MKYGTRLKAYFKKIFIKNQYMSPKVNGKQFEHKILEGNKHCKILIEPKSGSCHEYLSIILLDSVLIYPNSYCSKKYYSQVFFKKSIYTKDKETELLGKHIYF